MPEQLISQSRTLTPSFSASNSGQFSLLYQPGQKNGVWLDGYIAEMRCFCTIRSIAELSKIYPEPTEEKEFYSEYEVEQHQYLLLNNSPTKKIEFWGSDTAESPKKYLFSLYGIHRKPHQELDLFKRFTSAQNLLIGAQYCLWVRPFDLQGEDIISFFMTSYEEKIWSKETLSQEFILLSLEANQEKVYDIPPSVKQCDFKVRDNELNLFSSVGIRWGIKPGSTADDGFYDYLHPGFEQTFSSVNQKKLYFRTQVSCQLLIKLYQ